MKLIENNWWLSKQVEYKGNLLIVPVWTNWVATDENGVIVAFEEEPVMVYSWWEELNSHGEMLLVGEGNLEEGESWKETLEFIGSRS